MNDARRSEERAGGATDEVERGRKMAGGTAAVWVVRTTDYGWPGEGVFDELQRGHARIGWSSEDNCNLRVIQETMERGAPLDPFQDKARRCLRFLTEVEVDDYLFYPHQPERGQFSVARVTGPYEYSAPQDHLNGDYRSCRPCSLVTTRPVDLYDEIVHPYVRRRLGLQGRIYQPSDSTLFLQLLRDLPKAGTLDDGSNQTVLRTIHRNLRDHLPVVIHENFPGANLSRRFCSDLFERMGYSVVEIREGPAEYGSDVVVTVGDPLLFDELRVGVQVFSYGGKVAEDSLREKLYQLLNGWEGNGLDYGALLTTGRCSDDAKRMLGRHNSSSERKVKLIDADELADLFLKHFHPES